MKKLRKSNIELLRVVAMFLVLLVHADFFSIGIPTIKEIQNNLLDSTLRIFFEAISIICVNVFVLISGWFGIRPSIKSISSFIFQCLFFLIGIYIVTLLIGSSTLSLKGIAGCFAATKLNWFIKAYLLLYILSPVLNTFVEQTDRKTFKNVLIAYYAFVCTYGWIGAAKFLMGGYSTLFFLGLYLLARYMRIYQPLFTRFKAITDFLIYFSVSCFVTICCIVPPLLINHNFQPWWDYIAPTTIISAIFFFLAFTKIRIQSKFINWCGTSCFAVFLLHTNPNTLWHFKKMFIHLHMTYSTLEFWSVTLVILISIFFLAIIIDQFRIRLWRNIWSIIEKNHNDKYSK